jgi:hypothetical protein
MTQENLELIKSVVRRGERDLIQLYREDPDRGAAARTAAEPLFHPDFEGVQNDVPGGEPYIGFDGLQAAYLDWLAPWVEYRTEVIEFIECGERVLTLQHSFGRLDGSAQEVTMDVASCGRSAMGRLLDGRSTQTTVTPSKPWGLRRRRCRGRLLSGRSWSISA